MGQHDTVTSYKAIHRHGHDKRRDLQEIDAQAIDTADSRTHHKHQQEAEDQRFLSTDPQIGANHSTHHHQRAGRQIQTAVARDHHKGNAHSHHSQNAGAQQDGTDTVDIHKSVDQDRADYAEGNDRAKSGQIILISGIKAFA